MKAKDGTDDGRIGGTREWSERLRAYTGRVATTLGTRSEENNASTGFLRFGALRANVPPTDTELSLLRECRRRFPGTIPPPPRRHSRTPPARALDGLDDADPPGEDVRRGGRG